MEATIPNWTPTDDHIRRVKDAVNTLTNRRATMMEGDYPLTAEQVYRITTPPRLQEFVKLGYDSLQTTHHISYELGPDVHSGLQRRSITSVQLPRPIQYAFSRQLSNGYIEGNPIYFNKDGIDSDNLQKLVDWTNQAVFERRLAKLCTDTVSQFFDLRLGGDKGGYMSMYHIMARWPGLAVVYPRATGNWRGGDMWERHSKEVPRNLQRWGWPAYGPEADWYSKYKPRMEQVEETLLSCVSLKNDHSPQHVPQWREPRKLRAQLADWQVLGGAPF